MRIFCTINLIIAFIATAIWFNACKKTNESRTAPISFNIPPGFPAPQYSFDQNPLTEQGFELGRKLFYDGKTVTGTGATAKNVYGFSFDFQFLAKTDFLIASTNIADKVSVKCNAIFRQVQ